MTSAASVLNRRLAGVLDGESVRAVVDETCGRVAGSPKDAPVVAPTMAAEAVVRRA